MNLLFPLLGLVQKTTAIAAVVQLETPSHLENRNSGAGGTQRFTRLPRHAGYHEISEEIGL